MNKEQFEKELDMRLASLREEMMQKFEEQEEQEQTFPKIGDTYYFLTSVGEVYRAIWRGDEFDKIRLAIGNVFRTKDEAEFELERLKVIAELKKYAEPEGKKWDGENTHWCINYNLLEQEIHYCLVSYTKYAEIYFDSLEKAEEAIKAVGEDRVKRFYLRVEE